MTTAPAPISANLPIVIPQMIVAFAPIVAPSLTNVLENSSLVASKALGVITLVKTQDGPQKTLFPIATP